MLTLAVCESADTAQELSQPSQLRGECARTPTAHRQQQQHRAQMDVWVAAVVAPVLARVTRLPLALPVPQ